MSTHTALTVWQSRVEEVCHGMQAECSATAESLEAEIAAKQAELADVTAEQQAREAQATDLDRQIADTERRLQVCLQKCCSCTVHTHLLL